ncbi:MAG: helix-turn-helix domain-containing protein [Carbonactinosporaceae bacterium]
MGSDLGLLATRRFWETLIVGEALRSIAALLPANWGVDERADIRLDGRRLDAIIDLTAPNGDRVSFAIEAKRSGSVPTMHLLSALRELERMSSLPVLFMSDYIGPSLRTTLAEEGISFADATGWVRLTMEDPLVLLTGQGANRSPRPGRTSAVVRLNGVAASRTIRALATTSLPIGVRDLADLANVSPGSVSKLLVTLAAEGIADRDDRGGVAVVRRRALIRRWTRDYTFTKANRPVGYYIAPRGLERTMTRVGTSEMAIALTGSAAARKLLPEGTTSVVPLRLLALYVAAPAALARELGLIEADPASANVVIAAPQDQEILAQTDGELPPAPAALVLADLLALPGRSDAEAEQLMDALARDDAAWKE